MWIENGVRLAGVAVVMNVAALVVHGYVGFLEEVLALGCVIFRL